MQHKKIMDNQRIKVSIAGKNYTITTGLGEKRVLEAAQKVDALFRETAEAVSTLSQMDIAVLVSLQLAVQVDQTQENVSSCQDKVVQLTQRIDQELDMHLRV